MNNNNNVFAQQKLVNVVIRNGHKERAFKQVYKALSKFYQDGEIVPSKKFKRVLFNICPLTELKSKRVAGIIQKIPRAISKKRELSFGLRWLVQSSKKRIETSFQDKLFNELRDAYIKRGYSAKRKDDTHRLTLANRSNLKYFK